MSGCQESTMNTLRTCLAALMLLLAPIARAGDARERWFVVELMDQRAGWMHTTETRDEQHITTTSEMKMSMSRVGQELTISMASTFIETHDGKPVSVHVSMSFGGEPNTSLYEFLEDGVRQTSTSGGREAVTMHRLIEGVWLTPAATEQFIRQRLEAGAKSFTVRTIDAQTQLQPVVLTYTDLTPVKIELMGRTVTATKATTTNSIAPGVVTTEYIDARGSSLRSETAMGGMKFVTIAADRELALADAVAPELMVQTFVVPDKPIVGSRTLRTATYELRVPDGTLDLPPTTGAQSAERVDERTTRVTVETRRNSPAGEVDRAEYLAPTSMLDTRDEIIVSLRKQALDGVAPEPIAQAEALRRFVHRHVSNKSLGVGFASASEVARSCEGDCSEHGVLLAALLRSADIPARVVSGLVYVDEFGGSKGIFGYHMWTQALLQIEGEATWVDLDPTLPGNLVFDATHIALGTSSLKDGETVNGLIHLLPLLGRLEIRVIDSK
jgi:hypothetical protein